jgi:hypothetical protein
VRLKLIDPMWLPTYAAQVYQQVRSNEEWARLFENAAVLVPVPGSSTGPQAPTRREPLDAHRTVSPLWAAERLACALRGIGLGASVWHGLRRVSAVRKSATALNAERPTVRQHYDSFAVTTSPPGPAIPQRFVLVDDVITKGRTIFAAALRLHDAFPNADIRAFALVRTMGFVQDVRHTLEPCNGVLRWAAGDVHREP